MKTLSLTQRAKQVIKLIGAVCQVLCLRHETLQRKLVETERKLVIEYETCIDLEHRLAAAEARVRRLNLNRFELMKYREKSDGT